MGLHQRLTLSPFCFALVMGELLWYIQGEMPWCMLFADNIVWIDETCGEVDSRLEVQRQIADSKGFKLTKNKTDI